MRREPIEIFYSSACFHSINIDFIVETKKKRFCILEAEPIRDFHVLLPMLSVASHAHLLDFPSIVGFKHARLCVDQDTYFAHPVPRTHVKLNIGKDIEIETVSSGYRYKYRYSYSTRI